MKQKKLLHIVMSTMKFQKARVLSDGSDSDQGVTGSLFKDRNLSRNLKGSVGVPGPGWGGNDTMEGTACANVLKGCSIRWA